MTAELQSRQRNETKGVRGLMFMSFSALGIIYSDIGTSPLYVLSTLFPSSGPVPSNEDVVGSISAIIWSLTLVPLLKYSFIALHFGTGEGEGGTFALWTALFPRKVPSDEDRQLTRYLTEEAVVEEKVGASNRTGFNLLHKSKWPLMVWALFGTSLVLGDGVLTPAVSVVSAVGGIAVAKPSVLDSVVPISIAFLLILFLVQSLGTKKISYAFAPITFVWFLLLAVCGAINISKFPGIFRAFDPSRAVMFFVRTKNFDALSSILLAITGCEAIFANLGQFTPSSIRIGFIFAYVCLVLAYLGQGARIITDGEAVMSSLFYATIPGGIGGGLYWVTFLFAILACLIASQTMITACFSLIQQLINFDACPRFRMKFTSSTSQGQIYFAAINYTLMVAVIATIGGFKTSFSLTNAYGFAVSTVMFITTSFLTLSIPFTKDLPWPLAIVFFLFFGFIDALFWGSSFRKVPHGAWYPLAIGVALTIMLSFYTWARHSEYLFDSKNHSKLSHIITRSSSLTKQEDSKDFKYDVGEEQDRSTSAGVRILVDDRHKRETAMGGDDDETPAVPDETLWLSIPEGQLELPRISTMAIFHKTSDGRGVPHAFYSFLRRWPALPRVVIFLSTRIVGLPHVQLEDRYEIVKVRSLEGFYGITVRLGYRDSRPSYVEELVPRLRAIEAAYDPKRAGTVVKEIEDAARNSTHILPNYVFQSAPTRFALVSIIRSFLITELYARVRTIFPDETSAAEDGDDTIHIGVNAQI